MTDRRFARFAWGVLAWNLAVIVWGAFVRATGSGAGCGRHWPTCQGEVVPRSPGAETVIEFTHRLTSGIALLTVVALVVWAFRAFERGSPVRRAAAFSMVFMIAEALVGAWLVLAGLVADNASIGRAWVMSIHLVNTFLLLASISLTAWFGSGAPGFRVRDQGRVGVLLGLGLLGMMLLGVSGAVTALGDTLFRVETLAEGLAQDVSDSAHAFVRLRILHPTIAIFVGALVVASGVVASLYRPNPMVRRLSTVLTVAFVVQLGLGVLNLVLLAPVWMQLVHLLVADVVWISLVLLTGAAFGQTRPQPAMATGPQRLEPRQHSGAA